MGWWSAAEWIIGGCDSPAHHIGNRCLNLWARILYSSLLVRLSRGSKLWYLSISNSEEVV